MNPKFTLDCEYCFNRSIIEIEEEGNTIEFCPQCGEKVDDDDIDELDFDEYE